MKKIFCICLIMFALLLCACQETTNFRKETYFFYPEIEESYGYNAQILGNQKAEGAGKNEAQLINEYLSGPTDPSLYSPFPQGTKLISFEIVENQATIILSDEYSTLKDLSLTLANASLSRTIFELCSVDTIVVQCENVQIASQRSYTITKNTYLFRDDFKNESTIQTAPSTE